VYENGGYIYKYNPASNKNEKVPIKVFGDFPYTLSYLKDVKDFINWFEVSPTGKRGLFEARGDVFTVPAENGEIINLTKTSGIREIAPVWSPDGKSIAYLSDRTGEYEIFTRPADGSGTEKQITSDGTIWRFAPIWSPDSKKLANSNKSKTRIFTFGIGNEINTHLLDKITEVTKATRTYISPNEDIEIKISNFFDKVQSPVLTNLSLTFGSGLKIFQSYPKNLPDLFKGSSITVFGRYTGSGSKKNHIKRNT